MTAVRRPVWPVLAAAAVLAAVSAVLGFAHGPWWAKLVVLLAAIAVTAWAAWLAVRRPSLVIAPLAVCLLAIGNPLALALLGVNVETHAGLVLPRSDGFGLVFWKRYPGIAGWQAPAHPVPFDAVPYLRAVQAAIDQATGELSTRYRLTWRVEPGPTGITPIANGYGGASMFQRADAPTWVSRLDGSAQQHDAVVAAARAAAARIGLPDEHVAAGDPLRGDGTLRFSDARGALRLVFLADVVTLAYTGGPFLASAWIPGEFEQRMAAFAGLAQPAPLIAPNWP